MSMHRPSHLPRAPLHGRAILIGALALAACTTSGATDDDADDAGDTDTSDDASGPGSTGTQGVTSATSTAPGDGSDGSGDDTAGSTGDDTAGSTGDDTGDPSAPLGPDLDGDGTADVVLGARGFAGFDGALWIDYGNDGLLTDGLDQADVRITGSGNLGMAGALCDVDDDGHADLVGGSLGRIDVWLGGVVLADDAPPDAAITGDPTLVTLRGIRCADVTGDGIDDVVSAGNPLGQWRVTIVPGSTTFTDVDVAADPDVVLLSGATDQLVPVMDVGDVDGDGVFDVIVGISDAPLGDPQPPGEIAVFFGGAGLDDGAAPSTVFAGAAAGDGLGQTLAVLRWDDDEIDDLAFATRTRLTIVPGQAGFAAAPPSPALTAGGGPVAGGRMLEIPIEGQPDRVRLASGPEGFAGLFAAIFDPDTQELTEEIYTEIRNARGGLCAASAPVEHGKDILEPRRTPPGLGREATMISLHGATDPFTLQPAGPGGIASLEAADCAPLLAGVGVTPIGDLVVTEQWTADDAFSAFLLPSLVRPQRD